ncbi:MAG: hypothetical protein ACC656_02695 [Candidatus Heimdallarchaeota archaeon]
MSKSIQDKLEEAVDKIVFAPVIKKTKYTTKTKPEQPKPVSIIEPINTGESQHLDYVKTNQHDDLYTLPVSKRHKGYLVINK